MDLHDRIVALVNSKGSRVGHVVILLLIMGYAAGAFAHEPVNVTQLAFGGGVSLIWLAFTLEAFGVLRR